MEPSSGWFRVSTLLGAGNGKLSDRLDTQGGADQGKSATAVLGDLNGDGKLDLVVTGPDSCGQFRLYWSNGQRLGRL